MSAIRDKPSDDFTSRMLQALRDGEGGILTPLATKLAGDDELRLMPLGRLMPGLARVETLVTEAGLSTRSMNALGRAGFTSLSDLIAQSPASLQNLPNLGRNSLVEILGAAVREWAGALLAAHLEARLPEPAPAAGSPAASEADLAQAFRDLEAAHDFDIFRQRSLIDHPPTLQRLGTRLGISAERVRQREKRARERVFALLAGECTPIQVAADELRDRVGPFAGAAEIDGAIAELDGGLQVVISVPHRRTLLLLLAGLDPDSAADY